MTCNCPRVDGYVLIRRYCQHHPEARARRAQHHDESPAPAPDPEREDLACAWADYRKDYGVNERDLIAAHKAFAAGWTAAREGDQSGVLR